MDQGPLVREKVRAGRKFLSEFQKYRPIRVAFWLKNDEGEWSLYIASNQITDENFDVAYGEVAQLAKAMRDPDFDAFQVRLIGEDDPIAQAALRVPRLEPTLTPTRMYVASFGGFPAQEVYIYPSSIPAPA